MQQLLCLLTALCCAAPVPAMAQLVVESYLAELQPHLSRDEHGFSACGVRAMVMVKAGKSVELHDFSVVLQADSDFAVLKAGRWLTSSSEVNAGQLPRQADPRAPIKFWVAEASEGRPLAALNISPSSSPGFILGTADFEHGLKTLLAAVTGKRMQFLSRNTEDAVDRIFAFKSGLKSEDQATLISCMQGIVERKVQTRSSANP
ncbi:MAG TPA: hypothetical protein VFT37_04750 [Telluria sp.]|nr:hypothetical protein [Telluria sp.]